MTSVILSCPTVRDELLAALRKAGARTPVLFLPRTLHNDPAELKRYLQDTLDRLANIERVYLLPSGCGGGTTGLRAGEAELVVPRTRDCLDLLLSGARLSELRRDIRGIFVTASWMEQMKASEIDLDRLTAKKGRSEAEQYLRALYKTFNEFYLIDTGCYDLAPVRAYIEPLVAVLNGKITEVPGACGILRKVAEERVDEDFLRVAPGTCVPAGGFLPNR
ncbi:MAG: DUF1638 domain-containing protein [Schwartzia sp.]|nr:DUF1638 domain-containing protein [Schwartzia sp. (in: firmicutes)]